MTIRTPALILTSVLAFLFGACGAAPSVDATEDVSSAKVSTLTTREDNQELKPAATPIGKCHGKCCNFVCGIGPLHSVPLDCETCNPYADGYCRSRGEVEEAWWGNCR